MQMADGAIFPAGNRISEILRQRITPLDLREISFSLPDLDFLLISTPISVEAIPIGR